MSENWKFGDEYLKLNNLMRKARREDDMESIQKIKPRLDELNGMMWQSEVDGFPELAPFSTFVEALQKICHKNNLPFPDLDDREKNFTGNGDWKEIGRFLFGVGSSKRSIQIMPMETRGYISIEVYADETCYKGKTTSVEEAAIVLSRWYMQECTIEELHEEFPWMSDEPFRLSGPRMAYE